MTPVEADFGDLLARGEGGLMGLVVHPDFAQSRRFTTCQTHTEGGRPVDVRLVTWTLSADGARADRVTDPLIGGLPVNPSGRHSGCRPTLAADGALLVGTGDTARGNLPQDLGSLGGKVLRADLATGRPAPGNPDEGSLVLTYGHRNVQGVAVRPSDGAVYTAEHGPTTDDEVNLLRPGGNYGWDPAQGGTVGGYDESVPMTDLDRYPDAVPAAWSSGSPVEAVAGAAFVSGPQWGDLDGTLAVAALRGSKLLLMTIGAGRRGGLGGGAGTAGRHVRPAARRAHGPGRRAVRQHLERRRRQGAADRSRLTRVALRGPSPRLRRLGLAVLRRCGGHQLVEQPAGRRGDSSTARHRRPSHRHRAGRRRAVGLRTAGITDTADAGPPARRCGLGGRRRP